MAMVVSSRVLAGGLVDFGHRASVGAIVTADQGTGIPQ
jgi:hypothetical protein